jgi:chromosome partitioning protein
MTKIIAITNNKGGVGKTTSALNIGAGLARLNKKVLMIDLDAQANLSSCFGIDTENTKTVGDFLLGEVTLEKIINKNETLHILPSSKHLRDTEEKLASKPKREEILKRKLKDIKKDYDFIIIDCPPSLGLLTNNALYAADYYIAPIEAGVFSYNGISNLINHINELNDEYEAEVALLGILIVKYHENKRGALKKGIVNRVKDTMGQDVFKTYIREDIKLIESPLHYKSIFEYEPESKGAMDYLSICNEIMNKI